MTIHLSPNYIPCHEESWAVVEGFPDIEAGDWVSAGACRCCDRKRLHQVKSAYRWPDMSVLKKYNATFEGTPRTHLTLIGDVQEGSYEIIKKSSSKR